MLNIHTFIQIVPDPGLAEYKGPAEHKGTTGDMQQEESHFISKSGVNLLQIRSQNPGKYALALLDALFSNEEQSTCCYKASTKTNSSSASQKPPLSPNRVKLLEDCIDKKFGKGMAAFNDQKITESLNQKCRDRF
eukprot:Em0006g152a